MSFVGDEGKLSIELYFSNLGKIEKDTKRIDVSSSFVIVVWYCRI
jgi:hypothetical protein